MDIAKRQEVEAALVEREKFLAEIFSSIQDPISVLDTNAHYRASQYHHGTVVSRQDADHREKMLLGLPQPGNPPAPIARVSAPLRRRIIDRGRQQVRRRGQQDRLVRGECVSVAGRQDRKIARRHRTYP